MLDTQDCVTQFSGRLTVHGESLTVVNEAAGCETSIPLRSDMTFAYAEGMLRINGSGWVCTLYEEKVKNLVRLL